MEDKEKPRISNFDMFVSEHCKKSAETQLHDIGEPICLEGMFDELDIEERGLWVLWWRLGLMMLIAAEK